MAFEFRQAAGSDAPGPGDCGPGQWGTGGAGGPPKCLTHYAHVIVARRDVPGVAYPSPSGPPPGRGPGRTAARSGLAPATLRDPEGQRQGLRPKH